MAELFIAGSILLMALRYAGYAGLCVFVSMASLICNVQVLREAQFCFQNTPVALGGIMCSLVFVATDMITEHYGPKAARLSIWISFIVQLVFALMLKITLLYPPQTDPLFCPLNTVFSPMPRLFFASIGAYFVSQMLDIYLFHSIKQYVSSQKFLWLRSFVSTTIASFVDNIVFSALAWYILSPIPCSFHKLIWTYILGTYVFKFIINAISTPIIYLSYHVRKNSPCDI